MAIYHLSVKVISRAAGSSVLASAAYRSATRLHDERLDRAHDFTRKTGVVHSEILLPEGAPEHLGDRERLWNAVEAGEKRKDAQLSREVEFAIPREMTQADGVALARDFVQREMVDRGMIADLNVHWDMGADGQAKPHAHVMLTLREVGDGRAGAPEFGAKVRDWNATGLVEHWREAWADHVNARLATLDIDASIDHRSLEAQGLDLEPQNKIGPAAARRLGEGLAVERLTDHGEIARRNGARIITEPSIALDAITHQQAIFTRRDVAMFVHRHSDGKEQFDQAMSAVMSAPDLVALGHDGRSAERFTSRDMIATELRLERATASLAAQADHPVEAHHKAAALSRSQAAGLTLSGEQKAAFDHVTDSRDLGVVVGYAGTGKSALLGVAREAWEDAGYTVRGAALSGIAAENLESGSGIASRTLASLELAWSQGHEPLRVRDVLVIDEAGLVGTRQMERVVSAAHEAGAKVVLVGDPEQLQSIEAGAAFRATVEHHPHVEITEVRRQREGWQSDATRHLATSRTANALQAYTDHAMVHAGETRSMAQAELIDRWDQDRLEHPNQSRIILTHTNEARHALNQAARQRLRDAGQLGEDTTVQTASGACTFAPGDRVMLLKNDRGLSVKNGMWVQYAYDNVGALTLVSEYGAGQLQAWTYDNLGRISYTGRGNGTTTTYGYDTTGRVSTLTHDLAGTADDVTLGFTYNPAGQIASRTLSNTSYAYTPGTGTTSYVNNGRNQVTSAGGSGITYGARQNMTSAPMGDYGYNANNELVSATVGGTTTALSYDPAGRLYQSGATRFLYDGVQAIGEYNTSGGLLRRYVPGVGLDSIVTVYEGSGTTDRRYPLVDERRSVISITNGSATAIATNTYDEYGVPGSGNSGRFQYTGQMWLPEAQLYHYRARAYAPTLGRFMQTDPIGYGDGANVYAYVGADPVNFRDPLGLQDVPTDVDDVIITAPRSSKGGCGFWSWCGLRRLAIDVAAKGGRYVSGRGYKPSEKKCEFPSNPVVDAFNSQNEGFPNGYYGPVAQLTGAVVDGGTVNIGIALEIREEKLVDLFAFATTSRATGLGGSLGAGGYYSTISPLGEAASQNVGLGPVTISGINDASGTKGGSVTVMPVSAGTLGSFTAEDTNASRLTEPMC